MLDVTGRTGRFVVRAYIEFVGEGPDEGHLCHMCDVETIGSHETIGSANAHMSVLSTSMPYRCKNMIRTALDEFRSEMEARSHNEPRAAVHQTRRDMDSIEQALELVFHIYEQ